MKKHLQNIKNLNEIHIFAEQMKLSKLKQDNFKKYKELIVSLSPVELLQIQSKSKVFSTPDIESFFKSLLPFDGLKDLLPSFQHNLVDMHKNRLISLLIPRFYEYDISTKNIIGVMPNIQPLIPLIIRDALSNPNKISKFLNEDDDILEYRYINIKKTDCSQTLLNNLQDLVANAHTYNNHPKFNLQDTIKAIQSEERYGDTLILTMNHKTFAITTNPILQEKISASIENMKPEIAVSSSGSKKSYKI